MAAALLNTSNFTLSKDKNLDKDGFSKDLAQLNYFCFKIQSHLESSPKGRFKLSLSNFHLKVFVGFFKGC